jgi:hypothetical protein
MSPFEAISFAYLVIDQEIENLPKGRSIYSHELYECRVALANMKEAFRPKPKRIRRWAMIPEEKETEVIGFVVNYKRSFGKSPTNAEIAQGCGFTNRGVVSKLLQRMIDKGLLTRQPGKARSLEVLNV